MPERNPVAAAGLRILAAIALYLVLVAVWLRAGLDAVYDGFVLATAKRLLPALTHYPVGSSEGVELLDVHNQAFVLVWIVALALVVTGVPPKKRIVGYTTLVAAVFVLHVAGLALQLHLALAFKSQESLGVPLLLPWEVQGLKIAAQLLFLAGLQVAAFVAVVLTAFWSTGRGPAGWFGTAERAASPAADRSPAVPRRSLAFVALAGTTLVAATAIAAWWIRERDPRHLAAHTRVGDAFARQQMLPEAERQYRAALRGGADTGQTWMALAVVVHHQGDNAETARVLERALEAVTDPEWRPRLERARDQVSD